MKLIKRTSHKNLKIFNQMSHAPAAPVLKYL